ncbi:MAG TPA: hypothetical protein PLW99_01505 [Candidatus Paceibacterota bacterium]|nr:hypothetical protein [Candidatus Paceibacterota bacterium]
MRFVLPVVAALTLLVPGAALAQSLGGLGDSSSFTMSVSPQYPAPYGTATLSFLSNSLSLSNATLTVSVGGKNIYQGSIQPVAVTLGRAGSVTNITATITSGGTSYSQSLSLQPEDVALVAEPIASVPPLYPGKPSVPLEGSVRVVAVANLRDAKGAALNPSALSYSWTVDTTQIANSSGIGRNAIMVASPMQYRARTVSVVVTSQDGTLVGGDSLTLSPVNPAVLIYANDPLLGILFDHALSNSYAINGAESTLYAAPFSFPTTSGAPALQWFLNGSSAQTGTVITLRPTGSGQGSASLSLTASAGQYTTATANLSLSFGATAGTNIFGL